MVKAFRQLIGLEAKMAQYEQGERFIAAVEAVGGDRVLDVVLGVAGQPADAGRDPGAGALAGPDGPGQVRLVA